MTTYAFFSVPAYGHVNPTLAIVQELVACGEQVHYFLSEEFRSTIEANGATFHSLELPELKVPSTDTSGNASASMTMSFMRKLMKTLPSLLAQIVEVLRNEHVDCIIYDSMTPWGFLTARLTGIAAARLYPTYVVTRALLPALRGSQLQEQRGTAFPPEVLQEVQVQIDAFTAANQLHPISLSTGLLESVFFVEPLNISFLPRSFQPEGETFDERYVFVGPSLLPRREAVQFPLDQLKTKQLLYISLGTGFNDRPDIFNACFHAFADTSWQVVLAHGKNVDLTMLDPVPGNFLVASYVPQLEVLQRASAFISHGGMNSTLESLSYGVPLVVLPQMAEQAMNARQVEKLGVGVVLDSQSVSPADLLGAVQQITQDSQYTVHAQAMQQTLREAGGYRRAADVLMAYTHHAREQQAGI